MAARSRKSASNGRINPDWGRLRPDSSEGMRALWETAARLNVEQPGPGEWVPWRAVEVRPEILPRAEREPDPDTVDRYAFAFDLLPPIHVQAGSLVLVDGHHRITAAPLAGRDHIRLIERDLSDEELPIEAIRLNTTHGRPLSREERQTAAVRLIASDPEGAVWHDRAIHDLIHLDRRLIAKIRKQSARAAEMVPAEAERVLTVADVDWSTGRPIDPEAEGDHEGNGTAPTGRTNGDDPRWKQASFAGATAAPRDRAAEDAAIITADMVAALKLSRHLPEYVAERSAAGYREKHREQGLTMAAWWTAYAAALADLITAAATPEAVR